MSKLRLSKYQIGRLAIPILLIIIWEILYLMVKEPGMASPTSALATLGSMWKKWLGDISLTVGVLLLSFLISAIVGVVIGFIIGLNRFWFETLGPIIISMYSIPKIALYPIFLIIFGLTIESKVAFSVFHGVFPILIICMEATRMIPNIYLKLAKSYQLTFFKKVRHILIPSIMPSLVIGLRMGFNLCLLGLILAEMFASYSGIGTLLVHYTQIDVSSVFALFIIIMFIALFFALLFLIWQEKNERKIGKMSQTILG